MRWCLNILNFKLELVGKINVSHLYFVYCEVIRSHNTETAMFMFRLYLLTAV